MKFVKPIYPKMGGFVRFYHTYKLVSSNSTKQRQDTVNNQTYDDNSIYIFNKRL
jgi:hypothetical protein